MSLPPANQIKNMTRKEAHIKAKELGHCLCSKEFTCPCNVFKEDDFCKCCGEGPDISYQEWHNRNMLV